MSFEVRTIYTVYDEENKEEWTGDSLDGYNLDDICNSLSDKFVYGCWIGDDTKEWVTDNLQYNYFFVTIEDENRRTNEIIDCRTLILVCDETDAVALKLSRV